MMRMLIPSVTKMKVKYYSTAALLGTFFKDAEESCSTLQDVALL